MIFREAKINDLQQLLNLEQKVIEAELAFSSSIKREKTSYYDIEDLISNGASQLILAEDNNEIVGTGYAQIRASKEALVHDRHVYLGFMYVSPNYRGKGINRRIIEILVAWSKLQSVHDLYLEVYSNNAPAIRAYEKTGFKPSLLEMNLRLEPDK